MDEIGRSQGLLYIYVGLRHSHVAKCKRPEARTRFVNGLPKPTFAPVLHPNYNSIPQRIREKHEARTTWMGPAS